MGIRYHLKLKNIIMAIVIGFFIVLFLRAGHGDYPRPHNPKSIISKSFYENIEGQGVSLISDGAFNSFPTSRHEILQTKLKGYRKSTHWGQSSSTQENVRHMSDDEFDTFVSEVEENDADLYWGAEY